LLADLSNADLTNALLDHTHLFKSNLDRADLTKADLPEADLFLASLYSANLRNANLWNADLSDANLTNSELVDAQMAYSELKNTMLERANMTRVDIFDANLTMASLYGAVLSDIQLNTNTTFGNHYTDDDEIEKTAWTLAQIESIARENAQPRQVRDAFIKRKDSRRRYYWNNSIIPDSIQNFIRKLKIRVNNIKLMSFVGLRSKVNGGSLSSATTVDKTDPATDSKEERKTERFPLYKPVTNWDQWVNTGKWLWAALTGLLMRYGESPRRVIGMSILTIVLFGLLYPFAGGIVDAGTTYQLTSLTDLWTTDGIAALTRGQYFSAITFTTIGYANVAPLGAGSRLLVTIESFVGALLMATLVFVLGRRSTR